MISNTTSLAVVFSVALLFSVGCATRGYEKAAKTSDAVSSSAHQVELAKRQIVAATAALNEISQKSPAERPAAFERYRTAVMDLERTVGALKQETEAMERQGRAYFDAWDARLSEMRHEDIRARSAARQQEVTHQFTEIQQRYQAARHELEPLTTSLRDLQAALGIDLTPAGLANARDFMTRIEDNARAAQLALDHLSDGLRTLNDQLNPASAVTQ